MKRLRMPVQGKTFFKIVLIWLETLQKKKLTICTLTSDSFHFKKECNFKKYNVYGFFFQKLSILK